MPAPTDPGPPSGREAWPFAFLPMRLGEGLVGPLIPIYAATFAGVTATHIGAMEATFQALAVLGAFAWGRTSDQIAKRKAFIVLGFLGVSVSLVGMAYAENFWVLFAWRGVKGFMGAAFGAVGGALIADNATDGSLGERMGRMHAIGGAGYVGGLVLGSLVLLVEPSRTVFLASAAASLLAVALAVAWIREPDATLDRSEVGRLFRNVQVPFQMSVQRRMYNPIVWLNRPKLEGVERRAWAYLGAISLSFIGTAAGFVLFPLYLVEIGISPPQVFALFLLNAGLSALLYRPMGRLADRAGYRRIQLGAIGARAGMFVVLLVPFVPGLPAAAVFLALAGITWAALNTTGPAALFRSMRIREKGELIGLYHVAMGIGSLLGALLGGLLAGFAGFTTLFAVSALLVGIALILLWVLVYPTEEEPIGTPT